MIHRELEAQFAARLTAVRAGTDLAGIPIRHAVPTDPLGLPCVIVAAAAATAEQAGVAAEAPVIVFSDSSYARGVLTQGWKAKANVELIRGIKVQLKARPGVELRWIAGHVGIADNERADTLANAAIANR